MTISLVKSGGWGSGEKLTSAQATALDANTAKALDKTSGATDTLESIVTSTGAGRIVDSVTLVPSTGSVFPDLAHGIRVLDATLTTNSRSIPIDNTGALLGDRVRVRNKSTTYALTIQNASAVDLAVIGGASASRYSADFYFDGTAWTLWDKQGIAPASAGGTGLDNSAATGVVVYTAGVPSLVSKSAGSFVGTSGAQTLEDKTLEDPTLTGAITITSYTSTTTTTTDGKLSWTDAAVTATTANGTQTTAYTSATLANGAVHNIDVIVTALKDDASAGASYKRSYSGVRTSGTWTALGSVVDNKTSESTAAWDCTIDVNSGTVRVRVTGAASTNIRWHVRVLIHSGTY